MRKNEGFTLIEVLVAMSILMMLVATIIPIDLLVKQERKILQNRRAISMKLHDELQAIVWNKQALENTQFKIGSRSVELNFVSNHPLVKGCANWENEKKRREKICLYGFQEK